MINIIEYGLREVTHQLWSPGMEVSVRLRTESLRQRGKEKGAVCKRKEHMILCGWRES